MKKNTVKIRVLSIDKIADMCSVRRAGVTEYFWYKKGFTFTHKEESQLPKDRIVEVTDEGEYYLWIGKYCRYTYQDKEWKIHKDFVEQIMEEPMGLFSKGLMDVPPYKGLESFKKLKIEETLALTYINSGLTFEDFCIVAKEISCIKNNSNMLYDMSCPNLTDACNPGKCWMYSQHHTITDEMLEELRIEMKVPDGEKEEPKQSRFGWKTGVGLLVLGACLYKFKS